MHVHGEGGEVSKAERKKRKSNSIFLDRNRRTN
jgi:hypothetical protein